ncbi:MAG TPA: TonB-dependent receptor [Acidobacteriota bacterium]|jgi:hypothetical protein|nr:TonB-dependent receptor [Acidobacteriota bacterium]
MKRRNPILVKVIKVAREYVFHSVFLSMAARKRLVFVRSWLLVLLILLTFFAGVVDAAVTFKIEGQVQDSKNSPVSAATVILLRPGSQFRSTVRTDPNGSFVFPEVSPGNYQLVAQAAGGIAAQAVELKSKDLTINLKLAPPSTAAPGSSPEGIPTEGSEAFTELNFNLPGGDTTSVPNGGILPPPGGESVSIIRSGAMADRFDRPAFFGPGDEFRRADNRRNSNRFESRIARGLSGPGGPGERGDGARQMVFAGPGGGPQLPGGGDFGGGGGGGGVMIYRMGGARANRLQGTLSFGWNGSTLNARPYSLSGQEVPENPYNTERFNASIGGPIPWLGAKTGSQAGQRGRPQFFLNYSLNNGHDLFTGFSRVPTALERQGDFSESFFSTGPLAGRPVRIFNPFGGGGSFAGNRIPASQLNPIAVALLQFIPLPNQEGQQNFYTQRAVGNRAQNVNLNFNTPLTNQSRLTLSYNTSHRTNDIANRFPLLGGEGSGNGQALSLGLSHTIRRGLIEQFNVRANRNTGTTQNSFAFKRDIEGELGISGVSRSPVNWGVPSIQFTSFGGLQDANASVTSFQQLDTSYSLNWVRGYHSFHFSAGFQRLWNNRIADPNGRGIFTFSGFSTSAFDQLGHALPGTGFDFADFLLGLPQATTVRFGAPDSYLRNWELNGYVQDNWKMLPNLTLDLGVRYDLIMPGAEKYDRLANLDIAPGFTAVQTVIAGQQGAFSGDLPRSLIFPDKNNFSPRIGIAFKPWTNRPVVIRAGYGVIYNDSIYRQLTGKLVSQPPFSFSQKLLTQPDRVLTLETGFPPDPAHPIQNTLAIDPHYRSGYVQNWNWNIQLPLPARLVAIAGYQGSKGTALDLQRSPNRAQPGSSLNTDQRRRIPDAQEFLYQSSAGASSFHSMHLSVQRRFAGGFSANGNYTFGKSIDNMSSVGGGNGSVAQNDDDLRSERGLSDFDVRHRLGVSGIWQLPFGRGKRFSSAPAWLNHSLGGWTLIPNFQTSSGRPFTARVLGNQSNNSGTGAIGSLRATVTGQPVPVDHPTTALFFNPNAFQLPPPGDFGNAGRNTIIGPGSMQMNLIVNRTFPFGDRKRLAVTLAAINVTNHPNFRSIDTVVNSAAFGQVTSIGPMRTVQLDFRFIF